MTDRELDDLIWLRVLGNDPRGTVVVNGRRCHAAPDRVGRTLVYTEVYYPHYYTDIGTVFRDVVPAMSARGFAFELNLYDEWEAEFTSRPSFGNYGIATDSLAARAICLAALRALGEAA